MPSLISAFNSSVSGTSKFSPYFIVFHRDPILPIDTILRPREVYYGDQFLPKSLETIHKSYYPVRQRLKRQALKNKMYYNKKNRVQDIMFEIGNSVYLKNNQKQGKLDSNWIPHFRILQQTGSSSYIVQHQVTGKIRRVHADHLRLAIIDNQWDDPDRSFRKKATQNALHDLIDKISDPSSSESEVSGEDHSDDEMVSTETSYHETETESIETECPEIEIKSTNDHIEPVKPVKWNTVEPKLQPTHQAKLKSIEKMKQVREISANLPNLQKYIQEEVQRALSQFMQSFTSTLVTSVPNTSSN